MYEEHIRIIDPIFVVIEIKYDMYSYDSLPTNITLRKLNCLFLPIKSYVFLLHFVEKDFIIKHHIKE